MPRGVRCNEREGNTSIIDSVKERKHKDKYKNKERKEINVVQRAC